jgi:hypothetical protein
LASKPVERLGEDGFLQVPPEWAESFFVSHNTIAFSKHAAPSEDPVTYVIALLFLLMTFAALCLTLAPRFQSRILREEQKQG